MVVMPTALTIFFMVIGQITCAYYIWYGIALVNSWLTKEPAPMSVKTLQIENLKTVNESLIKQVAELSAQLEEFNKKLFAKIMEKK